MAVETDPRLRRLERRALLISGITMVAAAASGGGMRAVLGVIAGTAVTAMSYTAIRAGVDAMVASAAVTGAAAHVTTSWTVTWRLVKFITRFAILGVIAYVMMVRLRAHPIWMLLGASSLVAAAALEAVRAPRARP